MLGLRHHVLERHRRRARGRAVWLPAVALIACLPTVQPVGPPVGPLPGVVAARPPGLRPDDRRGTTSPLARVGQRRPTISYRITLDPARPDTAEIALRVSGVGRTFRLAMAVHPEYDDRYWRYLEALRVEDGRGQPAGTVAREDSTVWRVHLTGDGGIIRYRVHLVPPDPGAFPGSWRPYLGREAALVNGPDFLLYLPDFAAASASLALSIPRDWRIATGLEPTQGPDSFRARNAAELLDAPILMGRLHQWRFSDRGLPYLVAYLPSDSAVPFDTAAFVRDLHTLVRTTVGVLGSAPFRRYAFLLRDGAGGALEHYNSVTFGFSSRDLARDPRAVLGSVAHEFFHSWNLVALRPAGYGGLSYRPPTRTRGLWWGEGVTMHYADALLRRAGLAPVGESRVDHLAEILGQYYDSPASRSVSPERASLSFGDTPIENPDALANYYLQGQVIGLVLDGLIRDSTREARGLDDVMRAMYRQRSARGFTDVELQATADRVCGCNLDGFFRRHVSGSEPPDVELALARLGLRANVDTVAAVDSRGQPVAELDGRATQRLGAGPVRLVLLRPGGAWARAGLRTGDTLVAVNGRAVRTAADFRQAMRGVNPGDSIAVDVLRAGAQTRLVVRVGRAVRTRVRLQPIAGSGAAASARLRRWQRGY